MKNKRKILLIDDKIPSENYFWEKQDENIKEKFCQKYELKVFNYRSGQTLEQEKSNIISFLEKESLTANVLFLDMMFPGDDKGGLKILDFIKRKKIDIPLVVIISKTEDQTISLELEGQPYVHREKKLDIGNLTAKLDKLFETRRLFHPERGILIAHGTDTLSYITEFLKYGIKELEDVNLIVTGSQISMGEPGSASDAIDNVRSSVLLLQHLFSPEIGVVFNRGEQYYRSNIQKISKWHPIAFHGSPDAQLDWDRFTTWNDDIRIHFHPKPLKELTLFRTGGTIEEIREKRRGFVPGGDFVASFITGNMANCYENFRSIPFSALDSSNMCIEDWVKLLERIANECQIKIDQNFEKRVGLVVPTPFFTTEDYLEFMNRFEGIVIAGYGAGNANIVDQLDYQYSLLKAVEKYIVKHPVVLSSQVPREDADFEYETGLKFIQAGCIPGGHLSYQSNLVRLSYLLGHRQLFGQNYLERIRELYVQGLKFRRDSSLNECAQLLTFFKMNPNYFQMEATERQELLEDFYNDCDKNKISKLVSIKDGDIFQRQDINKIFKGF